MKRQILTAFIVLGFGFISQQSFAMFDAAVVAGVTQNVGTTSQTGVTYSSTPDLALSYGFLANIVAPSNWGLSIGALYVPVAYHQNISALGVTAASGDVTVPYYQFPVTVDYWLLGHLGVGVGGYYAISGGNITSFGKNQSFSQANYQSSDYGLVGKVQLVIPVGIVTYITATIMYDYGLTNAYSQSGVTTVNSGFVALGGIGISL